MSLTDYREELRLVSTALRDLSVSACVAEARNFEPEARDRLIRVSDYAEKVLDRVMEIEGEVYPRYLDGYSATTLLG